MKQTINSSPRTDQINREGFNRMIESAHFQRFMDRVSSDLERARAMCERSDDPIALQRAQGAVSALRTVLGLPQQMLGEMK